MRLPLALLALMTVVSSSPVAEAGFLGSTLDVDYRYPDPSTSYWASSFSPSRFTVGAGVETTGLVEGVTTLRVDFTDTTLTIELDTVLHDPRWNTRDFNGLTFDLRSPGVLGITSARVDPSTTMAGFDDGRVTFGDGQIGINWNDLAYEDGTKVVVDFGFAPAFGPSIASVPEPSSVALTGLGLAGLAWSRWRARARSCHRH